LTNSSMQFYLELAVETIYLSHAKHLYCCFQRNKNWQFRSHFLLISDIVQMANIFLTIYMENVCDQAFCTQHSKDISFGRLFHNTTKDRWIVGTIIGGITLNPSTLSLVRAWYISCAFVFL
ncbi:hypothetical protein ACJX0J_037913, partial [Zea mays]